MCYLQQFISTADCQFKTPIYGPENPNFTDFAAPGIMLTWVFYINDMMYTRWN